MTRRRMLPLARFVLPVQPVLLAFLAGCAASPHADLDVVAQRGYFTVHARDKATAERVLSVCEEIEPHVLAAPTIGPPFALDIYAVPVAEQYGLGRTITIGVPEQRRTRCVELDVGREFAWEHFILAHELAHVWLAPLWNPLPQILEEGLADQVAAGADPLAGTCRRLLCGLRLESWAGIRHPFLVERDGREQPATMRVGRAHSGLPSLAQMLELDGTSYIALGAKTDEMLLYAVGYALDLELGLPRLRELCERANAQGLRQMPAEWVLDAAGLSRDSDASWGACGTRLIGPDETRMLQSCMNGRGPFQIIED